MTDVNGPEASPSDNRTGVDQAAINGSSGGMADWVAGLARENRTLVEAKRWSSADDAIRSYRELEGHASKAIVPPADDAPAEDWNRFYERLGRPAQADGYALKIDRDALPAEFPYDETLAIEFRSWAHENGLTPKQAQAFHDKFVGRQAEAFTSGMAELANRETSAHAQLVEHWGDPATDRYRHNVALMSRAVSQLGLHEALRDTGLVSPDGGIRDARLGMAFAKIGRELFAEDNLATSAAGTLDNPFSNDRFNLTAQGRLVRQAPDKARALIRSAGKDPAAYGL